MQFIPNVVCFFQFAAQFSVDDRIKCISEVDIHNWHQRLFVKFAKPTHEYSEDNSEYHEQRVAIEDGDESSNNARNNGGHVVNDNTVDCRDVWQESSRNTRDGVASAKNW